MSSDLQSRIPNVETVLFGLMWLMVSYLALQIPIEAYNVAVHGASLKALNSAMATTIMGICLTVLAYILQKQKELTA